MKKVKENLKYVGGLIGISLLTLISVALTSIIIYTHWRYFTNSDVVYLVAEYLMFGTCVNMIIISLAEDMVKMYKRKRHNTRKKITADNYLSSKIMMFDPKYCAHHHGLVLNENGYFVCKVCGCTWNSEPVDMDLIRKMIQ